ncbi:hypothetical protein DFH09DRAFT_1099117 [Mycena vulgaris]|nr:hypothetical protein DFH09DRAFT_1099117 [Mycena vulgaris]
MHFLGPPLRFEASAFQGGWLAHLPYSAFLDPSLSNSAYYKHFDDGFGGPANGSTTPPPSPDSTCRRPASGASLNICSSIFGRLASKYHPAAFRHDTSPSRERVISRPSKPPKSRQSSLRGSGFWSDFLRCAALRVAFDFFPGCVAVAYQGSTRHIVFPRALHVKPRPPTPSELCIRFVNAPRASNSRSRQITAESRHDIPPSAKIPTLSALQNREKSPSRGGELLRRCINVPQATISTPSPPFKSPKSPLRSIPTNSRRAPNYQLAARNVEPPRARHLPPQERIESRPSHSSNPQNPHEPAPFKLFLSCGARKSASYGARAVSWSKLTPLNRSGETASRTPKILHLPVTLRALFAIRAPAPTFAANSGPTIDVYRCDQGDPKDLRADC